MIYRIAGVVVLAGVAPWFTPTCLGQLGRWAPASGVYVYGPPTRGQSTSAQFYPKNWRGPRYTYPQTYYFKFPPFRRPVQFQGLTPYVDATFFSGATTDAEIWAIRRKSEVVNLPDSARLPLPAHTRRVPVVGPLPKREVHRSAIERGRPPMRATPN